MTVLEIALRERSLIKTRRVYMRQQGWSAEDWYRAWQTTNLPAMFESAAEVLGAR